MGSKWKWWFYGGIIVGSLLIIAGHPLLGGLIGIVVPYWAAYEASR